MSANTDQQHIPRNKLGEIVENKYFQAIIIAIIVLNGLVIIGETYFVGNRMLQLLDRIIIWIFVAEMVIKLVGLGVKRYFSDNWNVFDFLIVAASLIFYTAPFVTVVRLVRVLRLLRMIPAVPALRKIVDSLMRSIPALTGILGLTVLIFSIYAIIGTTCFRDVLPAEYFGSFHASLFTLTQVVTFESWASQVARPVINEIPWAWVYFISFIVIGALVILNLVVAVIVDFLSQEGENLHQDQLAMLSKDNQELKAEMREIKQLLLSERTQRPTGKKSGNSKE